MAEKKVIPKTERELLEWHKTQREKEDKEMEEYWAIESIKDDEDYNKHMEGKREELIDKEYNYCKTLSEFKDTYNTIKAKFGLKDILYFLTVAKGKYLDLHERYTYYGTMTDDYLLSFEIDEINTFIRFELDVNGLKELEYQTPKTIPYKAKYLLMEKYGMFDSVKYTVLKNEQKAVLLCNIIGLTSFEAVRQDLSFTSGFATYTNNKILSQIQSEIDNYKQTKVSKKKK